MRLDVPTCRRLAAGARVARLATVGPDGPHLVPVVFALEADTMLVAVDEKPKSTRRLQRIRNLEDDPRAAVLVDHYEEAWEQLWWVRGDGSAVVIDDARAIAAALPALQARYPQYVAVPPQGPLIRLSVDRWSGWAATAMAVSAPR